MWPRTPEELVAEQEALAQATPEPWHPRGDDVVGACAIVFPRGRSGAGEAGDAAWAAAVAGPASAVVAGTAGAPYEPGLLALREGPLLANAVQALEVRPDVLLVDATGRDHPRRAGLALHLGAVLELPTIGVTHRPLRGLVLGGERVGAWVTTRPGARPVAVHAGWRTDVDTAVEVVLRLGSRYRTPEPLRRARHLARLARVR